MTEMRLQRAVARAGVASRRAAEGLIEPPRFLPPLIADPRFLVAYLAFSSFLTTLNVQHNAERYAEMMETAPRTELFFCEFPPHYHGL